MIETVSEHCKHQDCRYRGRLSFVDEACFYMYYTGEPRKCPISNCNRYKPGKINWIMSLDGIRYMNDDI
jgi:hypothetical protein